MKKMYLKTTVLTAILMILFSGKAYSQMKGVHLLGDNGLNAGTQTAPSLVIAVPAYWYTTDKLMDRNGERLAANPDVTTFLTGLGASVVTDLKILNANLGATILLPFVKSQIEGPLVSGGGSMAFSDIYVQPIQLGWHTKHADFVAGYALYIPTGKYEAGASDNSGLGMWGNEFSAGSTVYFDAKKTFNFSTIAYYEIHSDKKGTDNRAGNIITLEGGLNKSFYTPKLFNGMLFNVGGIYYMQFKVSDDKIEVADHDIYEWTKDKVFAAGLQADIIYPKTKTALSFRWLTEFGARNRTEGNTFFLTVNQVIKTFGKK